MASTSSLRRARKTYQCEDSLCREVREIKPGDTYRRVVVFPGDDANQSDAPYVLKLCETCSQDYIW